MAGTRFAQTHGGQARQGQNIGELWGWFLCWTAEKNRNASPCQTRRASGRLLAGLGDKQNHEQDRGAAAGHTRYVDSQSGLLETAAWIWCVGAHPADLRQCA